MHRTKATRFVRSATAFALLALSAGSSWSASGPLNESELTASEKTGNKVSVASLERMRKISYTVQFSLAFQGTAAGSKDAEAVATTVASSTGTSNAADNARAIHAASIGGKNLFRNRVDTHFLVASIALDILDGLRPKQRSDKELLDANWRRIRKDSFYFVYLGKHDDKKSTADQLDGVFSQGKELVNALNMDCMPAQSALKEHYGDRSHSGEYIKGQTHHRFYVCERIDEPVEYALAKQDMLLLTAQRVAEGDDFANGVYAAVEVNALSGRTGVKKPVSDAEASGELSLGRALYERTKQNIPQGWLAMFSEPSDSGGYKITVADGVKELNLVLPESPGSVQAKAHVQPVEVAKSTQN